MSNPKKYRVGITGGIGSGKSTVCRIFEILGWPVYYSDARAMELIHTNPELIEFYKQNFGEDVYICGQLNKPQVARILFEDPGLVAKVGQVVHPVVQKDFDTWAYGQKSRVVNNESALLFESGGERLFDAIITVTAPVAIRLKRVMERDGATERAILARMQHQWPEEKKCELSRFVIYCDDIQMVMPQVLKIFNVLAEEIR